MNILIFLTSALVIGVAGTKISEIADRLADRSGLGEALMGGVFLGACTSISGSVLSMLAAYEGEVDLAISNAVGGIAAQTFFLCLADFFYKKANLEHAAASSTNIMQTVLLIALISLPLIVPNTREISFWGIHPLSPILLLFYILGLKYTMSEKKDPMWRPRVTYETIRDQPDEEKGGTILTSLWVRFFSLAIALAFGGYIIKVSGVALANSYGISHLTLGSVFTAVATSLPELITTISAVKRKALTLAIAIIVGGNTFDVLFLAFSDIAYRSGSLFHVLKSDHKALIGLVILMNSILVLGLIRRERYGFAKIGTETLLIAIIYFLGMFSIL